MLPYSRILLVEEISIPNLTDLGVNRPSKPWDEWKHKRFHALLARDQWYQVAHTRIKEQNTMEKMVVATENAPGAVGP